MGVVNNIAARGGVGTARRRVRRSRRRSPATIRWRRSARSATATSKPPTDAGALQTLISRRSGEMTLDDVHRQDVRRHAVHTWDLARAAGVDDTLDPGAVSVVLRRLPQRGDDPVRGARPLRRRDRHRRRHHRAGPPDRLHRPRPADRVRPVTSRCAPRAPAATTVDTRVSSVMSSSGLPSSAITSA